MKSRTHTVTLFALMHSCTCSTATDVTTEDYFAEIPPAIETAQVSLTEDRGGSWRVELRLEEPAKQIEFAQSSDGRRSQRLTPLDDDFEFVSTDQGDVIRRKDRRAFSYAAYLEPTDIENPPTTYLPFANFGDGGTLLHTGRFHACADSCTMDGIATRGPWRISVTAPRSRRIIAHAREYQDSVLFDDYGDGTKVYIGNGEVLEDSAFVAVFDSSLPDTIQRKLADDLPLLSDFFGARLWRASERQMLFVSYNVPGTIAGASSKGGTLPQQVFMHFEGAEMPGFATSPEFPNFLSWFFAHEIAHVHQGHRIENYDRADSWIHEGTADAFAFLALRELNLSPSEYLVERVATARSNCGAALASGPLSTALDRGLSMQVLYDCGMILSLAAGSSHRSAGGDDLFGLWQHFIQRYREGAPWNGDTFVSVTSDHGSEETASAISQLIEQRVADPESSLERLLDGSGFEFP